MAHTDGDHAQRAAVVGRGWRSRIEFGKIEDDERPRERVAVLESRGQRVADRDHGIGRAGEGPFEEDQGGVVGVRRIDLEVRIQLMGVVDEPRLRASGEEEPGGWEGVEIVRVHDGERSHATTCGGGSGCAPQAFRAGRAPGAPA